ncbi:MAG TPA: TIR domain-containing protein [Pyrinomonadaceae bacterium]|jgi:predicted nucleotide-binding protein|nr:TIR domain-containing protein [Pyrinomonadaceae bacterium]
MNRANWYATILVVDDDTTFVKKLRRHLEQAGYEVLTAINADRGRRFIEQGEIDLAILDIHLDPKRPDDQSGLDLAVETSRSVPKLIVTQLPTWEKARRALEGARGESSPAVRFIDKNEPDVYRMIVQAVGEVVPVRVFIAHGRDDAARLAVCEFVRALGLSPVVLNEHAAGGGTVIESFEERARVGFAIAIMTPDDTGGLLNSEERRPRARQNVIFELGYFIGRLGRRRVAVLHKEDLNEGELEFPSNHKGVRYIIMDDNNGWKLPLAQEINKAGIKVDLNKALAG